MRHIPLSSPKPKQDKDAPDYPLISVRDSSKRWTFVKEEIPETVFVLKRDRATHLK